MIKLLKKVALVGLGLQARVNEVVEEWVEKGEGNQRREARWVRDFLNRAEKDADYVDRKVGDACKKAFSLTKLASSDEVSKLAVKVDELADRVERMQETRQS